MCKYQTKYNLHNLVYDETSSEMLESLLQIFIDNERYYDDFFFDEGIDKKESVFNYLKSLFPYVFAVTDENNQVKAFFYYSDSFPGCSIKLHFCCKKELFRDKEAIHLIHDSILNNLLNECGFKVVIYEVPSFSKRTKQYLKDYGIKLNACVKSIMKKNNKLYDLEVYTVTKDEFNKRLKPKWEKRRKQHQLSQFQQHQQHQPSVLAVFTWMVYSVLKHIKIQRQVN